MHKHYTGAMSNILVASILSAFASMAIAADKPVFQAPLPAPVPNLAPGAKQTAAPVSTPAANKVTPAAKPASTAMPQSGNRGKKFNDQMECLLEPYIIANVGSPVEGTLSQVLVDRGSDVKKGQVVARLNSSVEAATVNLRAAQEAYGQRKVQRNEELFKKDLISASDKDELETQTRLAALERKQQQEVLNLRTITSPLNGVVVERYLAPGDHIAQEKILKLAQIDPLNVEVIVPVELFGEIKPGMKGEVTMGSMVNGTHTASVKVVDRVIDAASGTFGVRLELSNPGNKIPSGIRCNVRFLK